MRLEELHAMKPGAQPTRAFSMFSYFSPTSLLAVMDLKLINLFNLFARNCQNYYMGSLGSRHNDQIKPFVSWHADPNAYATDAMCLNSRDKYVHNFPPFSMLFRVLQQLQEDQVKGLP